MGAEHCAPCGCWAAAEKHHICWFGPEASQHHHLANQTLHQHPSAGKTAEPWCGQWQRQCNTQMRRCCQSPPRACLVRTLPMCVWQDRGCNGRRRTCTMRTGAQRARNSALLSGVCWQGTHGWLLSICCWIFQQAESDPSCPLLKQGALSPSTQLHAACPRPGDDNRACNAPGLQRPAQVQLSDASNITNTAPPPSTRNHRPQTLRHACTGVIVSHGLPRSTTACSACPPLAATTQTVLLSLPPLHP